MSQDLSNARLDRAQLASVADAIKSGQSLEIAADQIGLDSQEALLNGLARSLRLQIVDLSEIEIDESILEEFPFALCIDMNSFLCTVVAEHWWSLLPIPSISKQSTHSALRPARWYSLLFAIQLKYGILSSDTWALALETIDGLLALQRDDDEFSDLESLTGQDLEDAEVAQQASVVRLVNEILEEAIEARASDIHIEAQEKRIKIRYRIDGVLQKQSTPPEMHQFRAAIISRLKIMAKLNIAEKRVPQDGRIKLRIKGREIDIRLSIIPMLHGEGVVMRVLDKANLSFSLKGIGMSEEVYLRFQNLIRMPHGIVLVTGPTGSGKTTTLYSAQRDQERRN